MVIGYLHHLLLGPAWANVVVLVGLVLTAVHAVRLILETGVSAASVTTSPARLPPSLFLGSAWLYLSMGLVWAGFLLSGKVRWVWVVLVGAVVLGLTAAALHLLRLAHWRRRESVVAGPPVAVVLLTAVLIEFGLLLTIRLAVTPDPAVGFEGSLTADAITEGAGAIVAPMLCIALVMIVLHATLSGSWPPRLRQLADALRRWSSSARDRLQRSGTEHLVAMLLVVVFFAAPLARDEPNQLTFLGIATPEYGKIAYLWVLAAILTTNAVYWRYPETGRRRHVAYPVLLFALVAAPSVPRGDLGPLIAVFAGTLGMIWCMLRAEAAAGVKVRDQRGLHRELALLRTVATSSRPLRWPGVGIVLIFVAVAYFTGYVRERFQVYRDPWVYNWVSDCSPVREGLTPPVSPPGTVVCQEALSTYLASRESQVAQSLSVIADGGIWGRGLGDTISRRLPTGSTDFVLAVMWNKLGGLVLLVVAALVALLGWALMRTWWRLQASSSADGAPATRGQLYTVGLATVLVGQFLFVFLASVNALPHSGIAVPFLSRGGQSTLALTLGVIIAMVLAYRGGQASQAVVPDSPPARPAQRPQGLAPVIAFFLCLGLVIGTTARPYAGYAERRPFCQPAAHQPRVNPEMCSTDRIAFERTAMELRIGGQPQYLWDRSAGRWHPVTDQPTITLEDAAGLLQVSSRHGGVVDLAFRQVIDSSAGTSLSARLSPPATDRLGQGSLDLTIVPAIQRAAATALRTDADGRGPLVGGIVVLDARSGDVLAAASAPADVGTTTAPPVDDAAVASFNRRSQFGKLQDGKLGDGKLRDGSIDLSPAAVESCRAAGLSLDEQSQCVRWRAKPAPAPIDEAELRRYVAGDGQVRLPPTDVNRALGNPYGLGSTFKVVVAAAYLQIPGKMATDLIDAPLQVPRGNDPIRNAGDGPCRGTQNGKITLTQALAVSCNTAFVSLARFVGWDRIRETAQRMGFTVGPAKEHGPAWIAGPGMGYDSRVPATAGPDEIGSNVLGGGDVVGTPLQMATVMATVANGGVAVQPALVRSVTPPETGQPDPLASERRGVLTPPQAEQLRLALSRTTSEGGTASGLGTDPPLWVKTGTHVIYTGPTAPPPDKFARQVAWLTGFLDTAGGPVAFAVAVETRDEAAGADRARYLTRQVLAAIREVRR